MTSYKNTYKNIGKHLKPLRPLLRYRKVTAFGALFAVIGTVLLIVSHAATPYASITADVGTISGGATKQTCAGASDGNCIIFGSSGGTVASGSMMVGLNTGYGTQGANDIGKILKYGRMDASTCPNGYTSSCTEAPSSYHAAGMQVIATFPVDVSNHYNTGGVIAINAANWVNMAMNYYANSCSGSTSYCNAIEVLNEPYGCWFWSPSCPGNAEDSQNEAAYAKLVQAVHSAFQSKYGSSSPAILCADNDSAWWNGMVAAVSNVASDCDGVVEHPYGGTSNQTASALGDRALVTQAHTLSGRPVYITEVGWPTATSQPATGDSLQWSEKAQADNIYNFISWARSTGYVSEVTIFGYVDYDTNNWYGVERSSSDGSGVVNFSKKPSWYALQCAAESLPENCAGP